MRIVSLLPSATEILFALGFDREIVGVSHECDFPPQARTKTAVIRSRIPHDSSPAEIDRLVSEYVHRGESLYAVDADALEALAPDLIITQDLCHVCAASPDDLATALTRFERRPEVLCLNPQDLGDVWRDILWVGEETCRGPQAETLLKQIGAPRCARAPVATGSGSPPRRVPRMAATFLRQWSLGSGNDPPRWRRRCFRPRSHTIFSNRSGRRDRSRTRDSLDRSLRLHCRASPQRIPLHDFPRSMERDARGSKRARVRPGSEQLFFPFRPARGYRHRSPRQTLSSGHRSPGRSRSRPPASHSGHTRCPRGVVPLAILLCENQPRAVKRQVRAGGFPWKDARF